MTLKNIEKTVEKLKEALEAINTEELSPIDKRYVVRLGRVLEVSRNHEVLQKRLDEMAQRHQKRTEKRTEGNPFSQPPQPPAPS